MPWNGPFAPITSVCAASCWPMNTDSGGIGNVRRLAGQRVRGAAA